VIGDPLSEGSDQLIITVVADALVTGGSGLSGICAANIETESENSLKPTEFLDYTLKA